MTKEEVASDMEGGNDGIGWVGWLLVVAVVTVVAKSMWHAGVSEADIGIVCGRRKEDRQGIGCCTITAKLQVVRQFNTSLACEGVRNVDERCGMIMGEIGTNDHNLCCRGGQKQASKRLVATRRYKIRG